MSKRDDDDRPVTIHDKSTVIQEARVFNESPISPSKCRSLLARIVYLLYCGETFTTQEATQLFFGVTKLFQHKDPALRQMMYLVIKELSPYAEDVIMVTSSIMKDMQPNLEVIYRSNAIRALTRITDAQAVQSVERFFKSAIVDRSTPISSAALISAYHLYPTSKEVIKRWSNEASESLSPKPTTASSSSSSFSLGFGAGSSGSSNAPASHQVLSTSGITQYHALGLLFLIRQGDRMAVTKMVQQLAGGKGGSVASLLRNPMAVCMLIRMAGKVMDEDPNVHKQMFDLLENWLRHKSEMVNIEAARAICNIRGVTSSQLFRPVAVLQLFLTSPKPALKFAAIRTLNKLAQTHPDAVAAANNEIENMITDQNRSLATFAITTLLKTGTELSVDRLMKQITSFINELTDEFKMIVVEAIRTLSLKFPKKQAAMLSFLSGMLRDEGGYEFKRTIVEAIFDMIRYIGECKETALAHLCEFIEDCEFTKISVRILHLLGIEGPKASQPTKYIRYIYNRVVLENAVVRAAAVSSLGKFGVEVGDKDGGSVGRSVRVLLKRCLDDADDEVRDRAALYLKVLDEQALADIYVREESTFSLAALESKLVAYVNDPEASTSAFDASSIPKISREQASQESARPSSLETMNAAIAPKAAQESAPTPSAEESQSAYASQLAAVPEFADYGPIYKSSSRPVELTESEMEYVVGAVKHVFKDHVVFQFNISNTIPDTVLEQVSVLMQPSEDSGLIEDFIIPVPSISSQNSPGVVYVSFSREDPTSFALGSFPCTLKFISKEVDPASGEPEEDGYPDEYQIEELELGAADYIVPSYVTFATEWERLKGGQNSTETFGLASSQSLKAACDSLIEVLGMEPLGGTELPTSTSVHTLNLSGLVAGGGGKVLARSRMTFSTGDGVTLELAVRAEKESAVGLVLSAI
ncbi:coatomer subunit gamma [Phaffia rhodozyma]|uniref:Coatomer subunit gamma n=1 Tax=Phaffia rhodozyma TaxID=264483 RepID=A0A0F7SHC2_PHARH|nr:coatomer subunit gamma [Phaffia rhodozyma]